MKRITIIILTCLLTSMAAMAQKGLNINRLFDGRFKKATGATEIIVTGYQAREIGLTIYHSLSVTDKGQAELVEGLVIKDGSQAVDKEVEYRNGQLYYGFYTLKKIKGENRYIFYLNQNLARKSPKAVVTLIYMEGEASADKIKKLIRK
ncbi:MAG: hypothetical protein II905_05235 [Muribaculaceae bacterium]|nr:hypothetical protein [Muribaculaceae bacterium]